jgi:ubiquinone/menaquinone biosynthesis C-methylase UbiE
MLYTRYAYAAKFCEGKNVLEVACGSGIGLGYLAKHARQVIGGDYTQDLVRRAQTHYRERVPLLCFDAHALPFQSRCFDVVLLYEALYYLLQPDRFLEECRRILREQGTLLISTVNKEWSDFNPSPFNVRYFSAQELLELCSAHKFQAELYGAFPVKKDSVKNHLVSFLRRVAVSLHAIPRTMKGKEVLKRLFLGPLSSLPPEVQEGMAFYCSPVPIPDKTPASEFKVLFAIAHPC